MEYLYLIGGLLLLVISGNYLVEAAVDIARKFKLSSLVIGMTIVAFGTSAPELMVSVQAALNGHPEMALGNVVGSNIANIGLILGLTAIILPIKTTSQSIKIDWPFLLVISILLVVSAWSGNFGRIEGIIAFSLLIIFSGWSLKISKKNKQTKNEIYEVPKKSFVFNIILFIITCAGVSYGAEFIVQGASVIATNFGISERIVSIIIVGIGTSLPELTASVIAAIKKESGMSLGNIIGSNIFNILGVLGITATIKPIHYSDPGFHSDFIWMLFFTFFLYFGIINVNGNFKKWKKSGNISSLFCTENGLIGRIWGILAIITYIGYITIIYTNSK